MGKICQARKEKAANAIYSCLLARRIQTHGLCMQRVLGRWLSSAGRLRMHRDGMLP